MKKGFTLAEVLITLGIIGIVAALTMPVLTEKVNEIIMVNKLKKMYSVLSQAMLFTVVKDGDYSSLNAVIDSDIESLTMWYKMALKPQLKISKECFNTIGCWPKNVKTLSGNIPYANTDVGIGTHIIVFKTVDGYNVLLDAYGSNKFDVISQNPDSASIILFADVNGDKNPNIVGKDIFMFVFAADRGFVPAGRDASDNVVNHNCSKSNSSKTAGYYCFEKLLRNNWKMDKKFYDF